MVDFESRFWMERTVCWKPEFVWFGIRSYKNAYLFFVDIKVVIACVNVI